MQQRLRLGSYHFTNPRFRRQRGDHAASAAPMIGGLVTREFLTFEVIPVLYTR
jgi:hypothetical protein